MQRSHVFTLLAAVTLVACSDAKTPTQPFTPAAPQAGAVVGIRGTLVVSSHRIAPLWLQMDDGTLTELVGEPSTPLASIPDGAQIEVYGQLTGTVQMNVQTFTVLMVAGHPAEDGVLQAADGGYQLLLTAGGVYPLINAPATLAANVGARMWITGPDDDSPTVFGVIPAIIGG